MLERGGRRAGGGLAIDERQVDRAVGVGVGNGCADARVHDFERDLFAALAGKRLAGRLAGFDLPTNELPVPALRLAERPTAEEKLVPSTYDTAYDLNHFPYRFHSTLHPAAQSIAYSGWDSLSQCCPPDLVGKYLVTMVHDIHLERLVAVFPHFSCLPVGLW